jgi:hypothetical protein
MLTSKRKLLFMACLTTVSALVGVPVSADEGSCPEPQHPKTCAQYDFAFPKRDTWLTQSDGSVTIGYYINPIQPWLPEADAIAATRAGFAVWEEWNPNIHFEYLGTTTDTTVPLDGKNVVAWTWLLTGAAAAFVQNTDGYIREVDIMINITTSSGWQRCEQADDSCKGEQFYHPTYRLPLYDVQALVAHEVGHLIGLGHTENTNGVLTMSAPGFDWTGSTLGLGDVLGAKALYPWTCPPEGAPIPDRYKRVCPSITIFAP